MYTFEGIIKDCEIEDSKELVDYLSLHKNFLVEFFNKPNIEFQSNDVNMSDECFIIGLYYENIEKNDAEAKKYYLMSASNGNTYAMVNLSIYYEDIEKNYEEAKKYYLLAASKGNSIAMNNLGCYYENKEKNYKEAITYYLLAAFKGNSIAMYNLGYYYEDKEKNYEEAKKYYLMAFEKGDIDAIYRLIKYCENIENYEEAKKYYLMAVSKGDLLSMLYLSYHYYDKEKNQIKAEEYYKLGIEKYDYNLIEKFNANIESDDFDLYKFYTLVETSNPDIVEQINKLKKKNKNINYFNNKKRLFSKLNNYKKCVICLNDDALNISLNCGHEICVNCFHPNMKCYYKFC